LQVTNSRISTTPKATIVAYGLLVSLFVTFITPLVVRAEENQNVEAPSEVVAGGVESPGVPVATLQTGSNDIVWNWTLPAGGLTPGAEDIGEDPEQLVTEHSTDITKFQYEFSKQGEGITFGTVDSNILTVITPATEDGDYTLRIWSVTRAGVPSEAVSGMVTFAVTIPDLPDLPPIEVPAPINTTPLINSPVSVGQSTTGGSTPIVNRDPINNSVGDPISNILQATNLDQAVAGADTAGMVKPSTQGWMIFGIAWYVWLVILVGMFIGGRLVLSSINRRKANSLT